MLSILKLFGFFSFIFFLLFSDSGASRKYVFGKSQTKEFLSGAAHHHSDVRRNARSYREPFQLFFLFCFVCFAVKRCFFFQCTDSVYRTDRDRRPCCGCKCGPVAVVLSADLHVTSDRWTENFGMYRKRRHAAGTWTPEHHRRCPDTNTRLFFILSVLLNWSGSGLDQGTKPLELHRKTLLSKTESKCFREWISQSRASENR